MALQSGKRLIPGPQPATALPDDLVLEILAMLPAKDIGRCKCVCTLWRSLIGSPTFRVTYRKCQGSMMLYTSKNSGGGDVPIHLFRFYYSPLRRQNDPADESIRPMAGLSIPAGIFFNDLIRIVNGLVCVATSEKGSGLDVQLAIYSVCTGEKMTIPEPVPYVSSVSTFHLGYDPASRTYKLLRFIFRTNKRGSVMIQHPVRANIITIRPSGSVSTWKRLNSKASGLANIYKWREAEYSLYNVVRSENNTDRYNKRFSGDHGVLCWFNYHRGGGLIIFDVNKEKFRRLKLPRELAGGLKRVVGSRAEFKECGSLAVTLWTEHFFRLEPASIPILQCFVLEEDELGERWSGHCLEYPTGIPRPAGLSDIAMGSSDSGEILFVIPNSGDRAVCCYSCRMNMIEEFWVGNFRMDPHFRIDGTLSCLGDSNHLYMTLNDMLSGII